MSKAVFTTKVTPAYDDKPEEQYHFPRTYLRQVTAALGDWIVYYEPRRTSSDDRSRGGRQAYFAAAKVVGLSDDLLRKDHFYAHMEGYLTFPHPIPFRQDDLFYESGLRREDGETNKGAFGRSVRLIGEQEFDAILRAGLAAEDVRQHAAVVPDERVSGFDEAPTAFERPVVETMMSRPFRDQAFRRTVRAAYDNRCAVTGLKLINGGGRPEVEAAHIVPVAAKGSDSVRNGLALSGTVHWMFDRGLISFDDDYKIIAPQRLVPEQLGSLVRDRSQLGLPADETHWPHRSFLSYHRENVFKG